MPRGIPQLQWDRAFDGAEILSGTLPAQGEDLLQWDRAFDGAEIRLLSTGRAGAPRFNGTALLMARKCLQRRTSQRAIAQLQWDRAFDGAEIRPEWDAVRETTAAMLQWDRAFDGAEICPSRFRRSKIPKLQWDRAFDGAEMSFVNHAPLRL